MELGVQGNNHREKAIHLNKIREEDLRNSIRIKQEFENIQRMLDGDESYLNVKASSKRNMAANRKNPVAKLSHALQ